MFPNDILVDKLKENPLWPDVFIQLCQNIRVRGQIDTQISQVIEWIGREAILVIKKNSIH